MKTTLSPTAEKVPINSRVSVLIGSKNQTPFYFFTGFSLWFLTVLLATALVGAFFSSHFFSRSS
jgi:hypothetical protein